MYVEVDICLVRIREVLSLLVTEKNTMPSVFKFIDTITIDELAASMYSNLHTSPIHDSFLTSGFMSECKTMGFLARSLLTPTTQTIKPLIHKLS